MLLAEPPPVHSNAAEVPGYVCSRCARFWQGRLSLFFGGRFSRMSTRKHVWMAAMPLLTLVLAGVALGQAAPGQAASSRLGMYDKDGDTYFALSLAPDVKADP